MPHIGNSVPCTNITLSHVILLLKLTMEGKEAELVAWQRMLLKDLKRTWKAINQG